MTEVEQVVLYRKYRPRTFAEVVGQEHVVTVLKNALRLGRVAHGYLFSGTRGTGKTTVARLLAKAVNCTTMNARRSSTEQDASGSLIEPCNTCDMCKEFSFGRSLDLIELDAASNRGIDEIRELRESVRFSPTRARRRVYIIDEVHMLTKEAFNALLKTLEEPPQHAMFILATTEPEKVPETIVSRVQHFEFRRIPDGKIRERVRMISKSEKYTIHEEAVDLVVFMADGSLRDGETALGQLMDAYPGGARKGSLEALFGLPDLGRVHDMLHNVCEGDAVNIVRVLRELSEKGIDPAILLRMLIGEARQLCMMRISPQEFENNTKELSESHAAFFRNHASVPRKHIELLLVKLLEAWQMGYRGPHEELPLELALLDVASQISQEK